MKNPMTSVSRWVAAAAMSSFCIASTSRAVEIFSADFEGSDVADGSPTFISEWPDTDFVQQQAVDQANEMHSGTFGNEAGIGNAFGVIHQGNTMQADPVGLTFQGHTVYTLSFDHFRRSDTGVTFGDAVDARLLTAGGTLLTNVTFAAVTAVPGLQSRSIQYATSNGPEVGAGIRIEFEDPNANGILYQAAIDNISLDAAGAYDAEFITPVAVTATTEYVSSPATNLINGSGLSVNAAAGTHDNHEFATSMWMLDNTIVADAELVFDLGADYDLAKAYVWQMNQGHAVNAAGARNVRTMNILVSSNNIDFTQIGGTVTLAVADGTSAALAAEVFPLGATGVRYVKFDILTAGSGNTNEYVGLSEVRFEATVSAPGAPVIAAMVPTNMAVNVAAATDLLATFNETVKKGAGNILIREMTGDAVVQTLDVTSSAVTIIGADVFINPTNSLVGGVEYYVEIDSGAFLDMTNDVFAGIAGSGTWSFSTDGTAPGISALDPVDNATGVVPTVLTATFDEDIVLTGTGTVTVTDIDDGSSSFVVDLSALPDADAAIAVSGAELTITPSAELESWTHHAVQISADGIEDLAGNAFAGILNNDDWSFTTGLQPLFIRPVSATAIDELISGADRRLASATYGQGLAGVEEAATHSGNPGDNWMSAQGLAGNEWIRWDLGTTYELSAIYLWNYCENNPVGPGRGINQFTVEVSSNDLDWVAPASGGSQTAAAGPQDAPVSVQTLPMSATGVRYVRFTVDGGQGTGNHGDANYVGVADVAFAGNSTLPGPPVISDLTPTNGAVDVDVRMDLVATFNETVVAGVGAIRIREATGDAIVHAIDVTSSNVTILAKDVTISPPSNLTVFTEYYVEIDGGAFRDLDAPPNDFAGISDSATWRFTTGKTPTLTSIDFDRGGAWQSGEPPHAEANFTLPGHIGPWYRLNKLSGATNDSPTITTPQGTFTFNTTGAVYRILETGYNADNVLREDFFHLTQGFGPIEWTLTDLVPGGSYDIICYGRYDPAFNGYYGGDMTIVGYHGDQPMAQEGNAPTEGDWNFPGVVADQNGTITGIFAWNGNEHAAFGGIQFDRSTVTNPPPTLFSIDFDRGGAVQYGDPVHGDGLSLPGENKYWYRLNKLTGLSSDSPSIATAGGTFTFNTTGEPYRMGEAGFSPDSVLRGDTFNLIDGNDPVHWRLSDLEPRATYSIICYGNYDPSFGGYAGADMSIAGYSGGNPVPQETNAPPEGDWVFTDVRADGQGVIEGVFAWNGNANALFGGIQFQKTADADMTGMTLIVR